MKPTIVAAIGLAEAFHQSLSERYTILGPMPRSAPDAVPAGAEEARVLLTMGTVRTDAALMDALPKLGLISCYGTGHEGVDRTAAAERGIQVTNSPGANAPAVAELAMALVLASARQIVAADRFTRSGQWKGNNAQRMPIVPGLVGRRMGIYGLGAVGERIATRAAAFEMEIGYHGRAPRPGVPYLFHDSLLGLAEWADIVVVAARAGPENRHAVNAEVLAALGPQGHIVNIARGSVIDEQALIVALETGVIAGAALDVYEHEPEVPARLKALENAVLAPHIGGGTQGAHEAMQAMVKANVDAFFDGRPLVSPVTE